MPLLELASAGRVYAGEGVETVALDSVSLTIEAGEFVSIMGPSGSGKSTLLHILGLLDRPTQGEYRLQGTAVESLSDPERAQIRNEVMGFVFQAFFLLPRATVLENVTMPLLYSRVPRREYQERAIAALKQVRMEHRLNHTSAQLSGGERQRTAIARALVNDPKVIFADEPTGNLDSKSGHVVMEVIDALHQSGRTVVVITHETPTARYAQRIVTMRDGRIESDTPVERGHRHYAK